MAIVYGREGGATATEVLAALPDPPSRTAVRTLLRILEDKGHLRHRKRRREFVYQPTRRKHRVGRTALRRLLETFYNGSLERAVAAHLTDPNAESTPAELDRLAELIEQAREREPQ